MNYGTRWFAALSVVGLTLVPLPGFAQTQLGSPTGERIIEPSKVEVPVPPAAAQMRAGQAPTQGNGKTPDSFVRLPPSKTCMVEDMHGLWKLVAIYESPPGSETDAYTLNPMQYIYFKDNNVYAKYNGGRVERQASDVINQIDSHTVGLLQYVVQDAGLVFFYQDSVAIDTQACFIVTTSLKPFPMGDMLLMPPKGSIKGRLVKEYRRVPIEPPKKPLQPKPQRPRGMNEAPVFELPPRPQ